MNADLEMTLRELGPDYRELVGRMRAPWAEPAAHVPFRGWQRYLLAASLVLAVGLAVVFSSRREPRELPVYAARGVSPANEYALAYAEGETALKELLRTQRADGGWGNEFLTRQNIAALRRSDDPAARLAVRRGMRNLRFSAMH